MDMGWGCERARHKETVSKGALAQSNMKLLGPLATGAWAWAHRGWVQSTTERRMGRCMGPCVLYGLSVCAQTRHIGSFRTLPLLALQGAALFISSVPETPSQGRKTPKSGIFRPPTF